MTKLLMVINVLAIITTFWVELYPVAIIPAFILGLLVKDLELEYNGGFYEN